MVIDILSPEFERSIVVSSDDDLRLLNSPLSLVTATTVSVGNNCGNDASMMALNLSSFSLLQQLSVSHNCFENVRKVELSGLRRLKSIVIGSNSFCNENGSFSLMNCPLVESLQIGASSMAQYSVLRVENTPSLEVIEIGSSTFTNVSALRLSGLSKLKVVEVKEDSFTNKEGVFELKNCALVSELRIGDHSMSSFSSFNMGRTPSLRTITIGDECFKNVGVLELSGLNRLESVTVGRKGFENCERVVFENLPELTSIQLGWSAFTFKNSDSSSLIMKSV